MASASVPQFHAADFRRSERAAFEASVQFRSGHRRAVVTVRDISPHGARISGVFLVRAGDSFHLTLPGLAALPARVAWVSQFEFGCEFLAPLSPLVLEAMLRRG